MQYYLYGIVWKGEEGTTGGPVKLLGQQREIEFIAPGDLGFLASQLEVEGQLRASRRNVQKHSKILTDLLSKFGTLCPVSFGTVLDSRGKVIQLVEENYDEIEQTMVQIEDQVEYGLKAYWDPDEVAGVIGEEDKEVRKFKSRLQKGDLEDSYENTLRVGELIEDKMDERRDILEEDVLDFLAPVTNQWQTGDLFDERMAVNFAFLLDRSDEKDFDRAMQELGESQESYLTFNYNGPWPPFSFVDLEFE